MSTERSEQNKVLQKHGMEWVQVFLFEDTDDYLLPMGDYEKNMEAHWVIRAEDGREFASYKQAMTAIEKETEPSPEEIDEATRAKIEPLLIDSDVIEAIGHDVKRFGKSYQAFIFGEWRTVHFHDTTGIKYVSSNRPALLAVDINGQRRFIEYPYRIGSFGYYYNHKTGESIYAPDAIAAKCENITLDDLQKRLEEKVARLKFKIEGGRLYVGVEDLAYYERKLTGKTTVSDRASRLIQSMEGKGKEEKLQIINEISSLKFN